MTNPLQTTRTATRHVLLGAAAVLVLFVLLCEAKLWRPGEVFTIRENIQIAEAQAWWEGRLDLPERKWDSALFNGRVYSHLPPMFSILSAAVTPWFGGVPHWTIVLLVSLPVPFLAYALFLRRTGSPMWAAVLALGLLFGTSMYPVLEKTIRGAAPYYVNHTLCVVGLLVFLYEYYGRRRTWLMGMGLIVAALSRQLGLAFAIPFVWAASRREENRGSAGKLAAVSVTAAVALGFPVVLNALKFGHPLDSGYMHIYNERTDDILARDAQTYGLFSVRFVPRNLYYANVGFPKLHHIEIEGRTQSFIRPNIWGAGIWWTTPLLLWIFVEFRRLWRQPADRMVLVAAIVVYVSLLFFHGTGYQQRGFNRYSLDYLPALLALIAPTCIAGWRAWVSAAMIGWSVVYFRWLI